MEGQVTPRLAASNADQACACTFPATCSVLPHLQLLVVSGAGVAAAAGGCVVDCGARRDLRATTHPVVLCPALSSPEAVAQLATLCNVC